MYMKLHTVKTAVYDLCGQRPPGLYDLSPCMDEFVQKVAAVSDYLQNVTSDLRAIHLEYWTTVEYTCTLS